jgi:hypothetical protein
LQHSAEADANYSQAASCAQEPFVRKFCGLFSLRKTTMAQRTPLFNPCRYS